MKLKSVTRILTHSVAAVGVTTGIIIGAVAAAPAAVAAPFVLSTLPAVSAVAAPVQLADQTEFKGATQSVRAYWSPDFARTVYAADLSGCNRLATFVYNEMKKNPTNKTVVKGKCATTGWGGQHSYRAVILAWT